MSNIFKARIIDQSFVYRSFPLAQVRSATAGRSLNLIGSVNGALERSLPDARNVTAVSWPFKGVPDNRQAHYLLQALERAERADWTIVSDLDCGRLVLADPDLLLAARQVTRNSLLLPSRSERDEALTSSFKGMSAAESHQGYHWRWVDSSDGSARFTLGVPTALVELTWSFTPMFPNPDGAAPAIGGTLTVSDAGGRHEHAITPNQRAIVPLRLQYGLNPVAFSTNLPCLATEADWRTLSIAVLQPELIHEGRVVLGPERFLAGDVIPTLGHVRRMLHACGFEVVTGTVRSTGHIENGRPVPRSVGDPLKSILGDGASLAPEEEIMAGADEVVWWACGDGWGE